MKKNLGKIVSVAAIIIVAVVAVCIAKNSMIPTKDGAQGATSAETKTEEVPQTIETESGTWNLVWNDEFDGDSLDMTKWDYQIGTGKEFGLDGWGNDEQQYYTRENVAVEDGMLKITALKEAVENKKYTSGRIRTMKSIETGVTEEALFAKKYGRFEAKMKMPTGNGIWPAFWLLPDLNDNPYGTWAVSGEIDIMEARGRLSGEVSSTIHYGQVWPNNKYNTETFNFPEGEGIDGYHVYAIEWEPGELRWYVDDVLYHTETSWYARGVGEKEDYPFPAPFNEEFYIVFNLAIGGNFDEGRLPGKNDMPAVMEVDYVRVYDKEGGYDENVKKPGIAIDEAASALYINEDMDYNYIQDPEFQTVNAEAITNRVMDVNEPVWYFLACSEYSGKANLVTGEEDGYHYVSVDVLNKGTQNYSVQLIQHFPIVKGYVYELSFDAKSEVDGRSLTTKIGGDDDNGWAAYAGGFTDKLTTEWEHYSQKFTMMSNSDATARIEINYGDANSEVKIANVTLKRVEE